MNDVRSEIQKGVNLLNERRPGWHNEVSLELLDMRSCFKCVLGQVYGRYEDGLKVLGVETTDDKWSEMISIDHGFMINLKVFGQANDNKKWNKLTEEWKETVELIRATRI